MTGGSHAALLPAAAPARSSVRETAIASNPLNASSLAEKFDVRFA
jgi:hypothetical protein